MAGVHSRARSFDAVAAAYDREFLLRRPRRVPGLGGADREDLAGVIPVVERLVDVDALVALQADQPRALRGRERLGDLRLADPGLALEQQRLLERDGQEDRGRQPPVGEVALAGQGGDHLVNALGGVAAGFACVRDAQLVVVDGGGACGSFQPVPAALSSARLVRTRARWRL